jgi:ABC-2 type transport system permease protein
MILEARRKAAAYLAFAGMVPKLFLAYKIWVWMEFIVQILAMVIFIYFWRAVYSETDTVGGLTLGQTLNYILLAQVLLLVLQNYTIFQFGYLLREGQVGVELLRPLDFQNRYFAESLGNLAVGFIMKLPLLLVAVVFFGLRLPSDPLVWAAFFVALLLGSMVLFYFDWLFACLAFYTTESWGLSVMKDGVATFFSGALIPLAMMPGWLEGIAYSLPFAQGLYIPVSILSGLTPLQEAPRLWLIQLAWLVGLLVVSRLVFSLAVRKVTVQGG